MVRAASGSAENIVIPLVLVLLLPDGRYSVWAVCFSLAAYVIYLDMGLQATVQANVARASGAGRGARALAIARSGSRISVVIGLFCVAATLLAALLLRFIYPSIPNHLVAEGQLALILIAVGQVSSLQVNVLSAYWAGIGRASLPSFLMASARAVSLISAVVVAAWSGPLPWIAAGYSLPLVLVAMFLWLALRRLSAGSSDSENLPVRSSDAISSADGMALLRHSAPLVLWNICLLFATGSGVVIVGRVDFDNVAVFSIGNMCFLAINGVNYALLTPLLSVLGRQATAGDNEESGRLTHYFIHLDAVLLSGLGVTVTALALVAGPSLEFDLRRLVLVVGGMSFAALLRLSFTPAQAAIVATNSQRFVLWQPVLDAVFSLALILWLGRSYGITGVVVAYVISACLYALIYMSSTIRKSPVTRAVSFVSLMRVMFVPVVVAGTLLTLLAAGAYSPHSAVRAVIAIGAFLLAGATLLLTSPASRKLMSRVVRGFVRRR